MEKYIVVWRTDDKGKVWTVEDHAGAPVQRDFEGVRSSVFAVISDPDEVEECLGRADGTRYAISLDAAREVLGWSL